MEEDGKRRKHESDHKVVILFITRLMVWFILLIWNGMSKHEIIVSK